MPSAHGNPGRIMMRFRIRAKLISEDISVSGDSATCHGSPTPTSDGANGDIARLGIGVITVFLVVGDAHLVEEIELVGATFDVIIVDHDQVVGYNTRKQTRLR